MKKRLASSLFAYLLFMPNVSLAETGESCSKIEDNIKRLACYDDLFVKKEEKTQTQDALQSDWKYRETKDEMRDKTNYFADNRSVNAAQFSFPYEGGSNVDITLRKHSQYGNDVMFYVDRGQFSCGIDGCRIAVKFDDNKLTYYSVIDAESGSNDTLFISSSKAVKDFTAKLKKAKKVMIELPFYDYGKKQFTFNVEGLKWTHF